MSSIDLAYLEKIRLESELAIKRLERMIEFLRIVYQEEALALNENQAQPAGTIHPVNDAQAKPGAR